MTAGAVTLRHVADAAGVSVSTASRALAGKAQQYRISQQTERSVRSAADRLGFRPSHVARSLRSQKSGLLGVLVPDVANPFFSAVAREVTAAADAHGLSVLLADSRETTSNEVTLLDKLQARQVEGLVICPVGDEGEHLKQVAVSNVPAVLVDRGFPDVRLTTVTTDHRAGAREVARTLIERGHRTIGCLQGRPGTLPNEERVAGCRDALREAGLPFSRRLVRGDRFSEQSGYDACHALLNDVPDVSALFTFSNQIALGALRALQERKLSVPDDLSLVTFDDHPFAGFLAAPLSTVRQDVSRIGRTAAGLLIEQIQTGRRPRRRMHRIPAEFVLRASIGTRA
ncbi:HTH-type transcriptional regulator DegA [Maioricimonas rarisocia]|uniref:HTH-type transcriptional regulator DegA n=1 Tax=Maioricimonas rarisocia TaxID=2528026 RepID=A0A517ZFC3_9PLAN|nr:LacI family DNA-binding transcriptional regulator [Maioricimonas rarisocia]QDU41190.1 HTH-type transcriptional regulator DegA [Maioricimonas rarisocia]